MSDNTEILLEAIKSFLDSDVEMGLKPTSSDAENLNQKEGGSKYMHQQINDEFALAISNSDFYDTVRSAFNKIHSFNYLNSYNFFELFANELKSRAVPINEIDKAMKAARKIMKDLEDERGSGWNPNMGEINKVSKPELYGN